MKTDWVSRIRSSVIAVPPLARDEQGRVDRKQNARMVRHLETAGVSSLLYGGNALFYHIRLSEYADTVAMLRDVVNPKTWLIPSLGPAYGMMMDQAEVLATMPIDTAMVLPQGEIADDAGIATGIRRVAERLGKPLVLYLKFDRWLSPPQVQRLVDDGLVSWIKYAVVRPDASRDDYLREILERVPASIVASGMGEQPALVHMREFGMSGFTSGCVCVHPALSMRMLRAAQAGDWSAAESCRERFAPLEKLRDAISPIRVLHTAVDAAGIAILGPVPPLLSPLAAEECEKVALAARALCHSEPATVEATTPGTTAC